MSMLPDEIWREIMAIGVGRSILNYRDLCCLSISCRRLNRISSEDPIWSNLLFRDFGSPTSIPNPPFKALYKTRFERDRSKKLLAWRRSVLIVESQIAVCSKDLERLQLLLSNESKRLNTAVTELKELETVRRASVALNVWQPQIVRGCQKQLVEQCKVPVESRIRDLKMEIRLCRQQIDMSSKACNNKKRFLQERKEALAALKYHPLQPCQPEMKGNNGELKRKKKKKKQKICDDCKLFISTALTILSCLLSYLYFICNFIFER
ncbi:F-box protein SKIP24 [Acorus gramineus]|uniref:F-box protein SKIP24 n=1 Tax=Acorus gramineus TaxID=55184 RepID=A0AAV9BTT6_ACOGR|nr:F-box protein SKIP24 [Acorus gramineus]